MKHPHSLTKSWIQLVDGQRFYPKFPQPENFTIDNIAYGLSNTCRFAGQLKEFYSVAEHSVLVSMVVLERYARQALLHDAAEAFVHDIATPTKRELPAYKSIEDKILAMIYDRYNVWPTDESNYEVKKADWAVFVAETKVLLANPADANVGDVVPADVHIECMLPDRARESFLRRFAELFPETT